MFAPRKFAAYKPAFDTISMTRMSSCIVSGTASTQWIAAFGGIGSVKVASRLQAADVRARTDTRTAEDRIAIIVGSPSGRVVDVTGPSLRLTADSPCLHPTSSPG